ncbi:MAG: DUF3575 domain-containing protein, partial [Candidatus Cryptobacteroides sp.]
MGGSGVAARFLTSATVQTVPDGLPTVSAASQTLSVAAQSASGTLQPAQNACQALTAVQPVQDTSQTDSSAVRTTVSAASPATPAYLQTFKLFYVCDETVIKEDYLDNAVQMDKIRKYLALSPRIDSIAIYAYASPEGSFARNNRLAIGRAEAAKDFILKHARDLPDDRILLRPMDENWEGLREAVERDYHRHDRDKVLKILDDNSVGNDTKKWRLGRLDGGYTWSYLKRNYMPRLRYATWICVWAEPLPAVTPVEYTPVFTAVQKKPDLRPTPVPAPVFPRPDSLRKRTVVALKTNMLYDAVTVLNFAVEVPINKNFSFQYEHHCPWWLSKNNRLCLQYLSFGGEFRWWFAPKTKPETEKRKLRDALVGHYLGVYGFGGKFDFQKDRNFGCYQGEPMSFG